MNMAMWFVAGAALGWAGFAYLNFNRSRGLAVSVIIGAVGGFVGGDVVAPMLGAVTDAPNVFNPLSMAVALASAATCLAIANALSRRFGV